MTAAPLDISEIKRRLEAAQVAYSRPSPGNDPWAHAGVEWTNGHCALYGDNLLERRDFVAAAPTDIAALLAEVERLTETVDDCREVICEGEAVIIRLRAEIVELKALRDRITEDSIKFFTERNQARAILATAYEDAAKVADEADKQDEIDNGVAATGGGAVAAEGIRALAAKNGAVR